MLHLRLGENPEWALMRSRERLEFTDPPCDPPPHRWPHLISARTALGIAVVVATIAILPGDSTFNSTGANAFPAAAHPTGHPDGQLHAGLWSADPWRQQARPPDPAHHPINHGYHQERTTP